MKTYSKIILAGVGIAAIGATAAVARNHGGRGDMGGPMGEKMYERMCSADQQAPKMDPAKIAERVASKLTLTDAQKTAFADLQTARDDSHKAAKATICADKPDFTSMPGRAAFGIKLAETHLNGMKTVQPKLEAFYATLNEAQKKTFNEMRPGGHGGKGGWGGHGDHHGHGPMQDDPAGK